MIIDAKPVAPIVSDETICEAGTVTDIVLAGGVGSDFTLTGTGGTVASLTTITMANLQAAGLDGTIAGTYSFSLVEISAEGCTGDVGTFDVIVTPEPLVTSSADVTICEGSSTTLTVTSIPVDAATVYTWYEMQV